MGQIFVETIPVLGRGTGTPDFYPNIFSATLPGTCTDVYVTVLDWNCIPGG